MNCHFLRLRTYIGLLLCALTLSLITACSKKEKVKQELETMANDLSKDYPNGKREDIEKAAKRFDILRKEVESYQYSEEDLKVIKSAENTCGTYFLSYAISFAFDSQNTPTDSTKKK